MGAKRMRCSRCGDVIGSYEPLILVLDGEIRETSRAAEPEIALESEVARFHRVCFSAGGGGGQMLDGKLSRR